MALLAAVTRTLPAIAASAALILSVQPPSSAQHDDEAEIRALERRFANGFRTKNVDAIMANYEHSRNLVVFDVVPPRKHTGWDAYKAAWQGLFASVDGPVTLFEIEGLTVYAEADLAFSYSFQHSIVKLKAGGSRDLTVRVTDVYRKRAGKWLIAHEHVSVPVDLRTGRGDLKSEPQDRHAN